jgi:GNAT superfamily N-acetyltransferase
MKLILRKAVLEDVGALRALIAASVRELQADDYSTSQIDSALTSVYDVDTQMIADGTYYVVESQSENARPEIVGCGGWSRRNALYAGDQWRGREDLLLDPVQDAAKIRAFFVHPQWVRRGIGTRILEACEKAAAAAGFSRLEMGATITGVPLYLAHGFIEIEPQEVRLANGEALPIVLMEKQMAEWKI